MEHESPLPMLNVVVNGKCEQRPLECIQTMRDGQPSRMVPWLRVGEEAHYTADGGIVITTYPIPPSDYVTEIRFEPDGGQCPKYIVTYADGHEREVSKEYAESLHKEMEERHAKF